MYISEKVYNTQTNKELTVYNENVKFNINAGLDYKFINNVSIGTVIGIKFTYNKDFSLRLSSYIGYSW